MERLLVHEGCKIRGYEKGMLSLLLVLTELTLYDVAFVDPLFATLRLPLAVR